MIIYLNYYIARAQSLIVDRELFLKRHDIEGKYQLAKGAPILVNVCGSYVRANDLLYLCSRRQEKIVSNWLDSLNNPSESLKYLEFEWRRN